MTEPAVFTAGCFALALFGAVSLVVIVTRAAVDRWREFRNAMIETLEDEGHIRIAGEPQKEWS